MNYYYNSGNLTLMYRHNKLYTPKYYTANNFAILRMVLASVIITSSPIRYILYVDNNISLKGNWTRIFFYELTFMTFNMGLFYERWTLHRRT